MADEFAQFGGRADKPIQLPGYKPKNKIQTEGDEFAQFGGKADSLEPEDSGILEDLAASGTEVLTDIGKFGLENFSAASKFVDSYTGAPLRAGLAAAQMGPGMTPGEIASDAWTAAKNQFGEDPANAPTGKDIAENAGVPTTEYSFPLIMDPFAKGKDKYAKVSPAGVVGGVADTVLDPTTYIPGEVVAKGAAKGLGAVEKLAPKTAGALGRFAERRAVKAGTGESVGAIRKMAGMKGAAPRDIDAAIEKLHSTGRRMLTKDEYGAPVVGWLSTPETVGQNAAAKQALAGQKIGQIGKTVDELAPGIITPQALAEEFGAYQKTLPDIGATAPVRKRVGEEIEKMKRLGLSEEDVGAVAKPLTFSEAQRLKSSKGAYPYQVLSADALFSNKDATNKLNRIISDKMEQAVETAKQGRAKKPTFTPFGGEKNPNYIGKPSVDLGDGYSLVKRNSKPFEAGPVSQKEFWNVIDKDGNDIGDFVTSKDRASGEVFMNTSAIEKGYRGKGLGSKAYDVLAQHYGGLASDPSGTSKAARRVYEKLGAEEIPGQLSGFSGQEKLPRLKIPEQRIPATEEQLAILSDYKPAKEAYDVYGKVADAGGEQSMRTLSRRMVSPSSHAIGGLTGVAAAEIGDSLVHGGLYGAAAALMNQQVLKRGSAFGARAADALSRGIMKSPATYQKWLPRIQVVARSGNMALAAYYHQLLANDPEFREAVSRGDLAEEP